MLRRNNVVLLCSKNAYKIFSDLGDPHYLRELQQSRPGQLPGGYCFHFLGAIPGLEHKPDEGDWHYFVRRFLRHFHSFV